MSYSKINLWNDLKNHAKSSHFCLLAFYYCYNIFQTTTLLASKKLILLVKVPALLRHHHIKCSNILVSFGLSKIKEHLKCVLSGSGSVRSWWSFVRVPSWRSSPYLISSPIEVSQINKVLFGILRQTVCYSHLKHSTQCTDLQRLHLTVLFSGQEPPRRLNTAATDPIPPPP